MNKLRIMEWNINGRSGYSCAYAIPPFIADIIVKQKVDIVVLNEFVLTAGWSYLKNVMEKEFILYTSTYVTGQNGIFIAVKKNIDGLDSNATKICSDIDSDQPEKPNFLQVTVNYKSNLLTIIGTRIRISDSSKVDYQERKVQIDSLVDHSADIKNNVIIIGDFNNSKICGDENKSYNDVKESYHYTSRGELSVLYDTYNYHIIKDTFEHHGFSVFTPNKGKWSWVDSYKNKYKQDHIISRGVRVSEKEYSWFYVNKDNGYGYLKQEDYKSNLVGYPDHAILTADIELKD